MVNFKMEKTKKGGKFVLNLAKKVVSWLRPYAKHKNSLFM